ncbi:MAG: hypothetical protein U0R44_03450 [Candidatus Micrarchaeia archaeon]
MAQTGRLRPVNIRPFQPPGASISSRPPLREGVSKLGADEIRSQLMRLSENWSQAVEHSLALPKDLFTARSDSGNSVLFSKEMEFGIVKVISDLRTGKTASIPTEYGLAYYETASVTYLVLADRSRGIIVREILMNYQDAHIRKDWAGISASIEQGAAAARANPGTIAIHDGALRLVRT